MFVYKKQGKGLDPFYQQRHCRHFRIHWLDFHPFHLAASTRLSTPKNSVTFRRNLIFVVLRLAPFYANYWLYSTYQLLHPNLFHLTTVGQWQHSTEMWVTSVLANCCYINSNHQLSLANHKFFCIWQQSFSLLLFIVICKIQVELVSYPFYTN